MSFSEAKTLIGRLLELGTASEKALKETFPLMSERERDWVFARVLTTSLLEATAQAAKALGDRLMNNELVNERHVMMLVSCYTPEKFAAFLKDTELQSVPGPNGDPLFDRAEVEAAKQTHGEYVSFESALEILELTPEQLKRLVSEGEFRAIRGVHNTMKFERHEIERAKQAQRG